MCHHRYDRSPPTPPPPAAPAGTAALPPEPRGWHCLRGALQHRGAHGMGCLWVPGVPGHVLREPHSSTGQWPPQSATAAPQKEPSDPRVQPPPRLAALASAQALAGAGGLGHALPAAGTAECGTSTRQSLLVINRAGAAELVNPSAAGQAAARALPSLGGRDTAPGARTEHREHGGCARPAGQSRASQLGHGTREHWAVWDGAHRGALPSSSLSRSPLVAAVSPGGAASGTVAEGPGHPPRHPCCEHPWGHA